MQEKRVIVRVEEGLHARPGTQFVKLARSFSSEILIERNGRQADAKSSVKILLLNVQQNDEIILRASGDDQAHALQVLSQFLEEGGDIAFDGEKPVAKEAFSGPLPEKAYGGTPVCDGLALAKPYSLFQDEIIPERVHIARTEIEVALKRFQRVMARVQEDFVQERARKYLNRADQEILDALIEVSNDRSFIGEIEKRITECMDPVAATLKVGKELSEDFAQLGAPYLSARGEDIRGMARLIALSLLGRQDKSVEDISEPVIIVAEELSAWDFAKMPLRHVKGLVFTGSAPTSHVSIMAKTHAIPTIVALEATREELEAASELAVDAGQGVVHLDPGLHLKANFEARMLEASAASLALRSFKDKTPVTPDGQEIIISANLGSLKDADAALDVGAMGVGLFRTELMFMEGRKPPEEDRQFEIYDELARTFEPHRVIIRTLDVGGDKPVPGLAFPKEPNPFLGWRGIRLCLDQPSVFKPQLKALLRASVLGNLAIMLPMIADVSEVLRTKELMETCAKELAAAGVPHAMPALGIMIETPAAVFCASELAKHVAFFSIGTNDLTQYVMAADRLSSKLNRLQSPDHPAVMRAIEEVCKAAKEAGIWVSICGEAASRLDLIPKFIELGVTKLSMSPEAVLRAKKAVIEGGGA